VNLARIVLLSPQNRAPQDRLDQEGTAALGQEADHQRQQHCKDKERTEDFEPHLLAGLLLLIARRRWLALLYRCLCYAWRSLARRFTTVAGHAL